MQTALDDLSLKKKKLNIMHMYRSIHILGLLWNIFAWFPVKKTKATDPLRSPSALCHKLAIFTRVLLKPSSQRACSVLICYLLEAPSWLSSGCLGDYMKMAVGLFFLVLYSKLGQLLKWINPSNQGYGMDESLWACTTGWHQFVGISTYPNSSFGTLFSIDISSKHNINNIKSQKA